MMKELVGCKAVGTHGGEPANESSPVDPMPSEQCRPLSEVARQFALETACAYYDGPAFVYGPSEQAVIPVVWNYLPLPQNLVADEGFQFGRDSFLCIGVESLSDTKPALDVTPDICSVMDRSAMLGIANGSLVSVELEGGELLAL